MTVYVPELDIPTRDLKVRLLRAHARVRQTWAALLRHGNLPCEGVDLEGERDIARAELEEVEAEILLAQAAALEGGVT